MKERNFSLAAIIVSAFMFLSSMEKYQVTTLPFVSDVVKPFIKEQRGIQMAYKVYNDFESKIYLDRDLISKGFQPIQLTIQNNTASSFLLGKDDVSLPLASVSSVAWSISKSSIPRSIAYKVLGFVFWPFMIPDTIDSVKTYATHRDLKRDYAAKSIKNNQEEILPFSTMHRIMFVEKEKYEENFSVTLFNTKTYETVIFDNERMYQIPKEEKEAIEQEFDES